MTVSAEAGSWAEKSSTFVHVCPQVNLEAQDSARCCCQPAFI